MIFSMNFFTPKFVKIRCYFLFIGFLALYFQNKLSTHNPTFNYRFVSMSELKFSLLTSKIPQNPKWVASTYGKLPQFDFLIFFIALFL